MNYYELEDTAAGKDGEVCLNRTCTEGDDKEL
jgi:hypothetical protein